MFVDLQRVGRNYSNESKPFSKTWADYNHQSNVDPAYSSSFSTNRVEQNMVFKSPTFSFKSSHTMQSNPASIARLKSAESQPWERSLPKTPTKHVRYDSQVPVAYPVWSQPSNGTPGINQARSSSEHSNQQHKSLHHTTETGNNGMDNSFTDYTSPASSLGGRDDWSEPIQAAADVRRHYETKSL